MLGLRLSWFSEGLGGGLATKHLCKEELPVNPELQQLAPASWPPGRGRTEERAGEPVNGTSQAP